MQIKSSTPSSGITTSPNGKLAVVASGKEVSIIDISDPSNPVVKGIINTVSSQDMTFSATGETLYISDAEGGLQIVDVSNSAIPKVLSKLVPTTDGMVLDVALSGNGKQAYLAAGMGGLVIVNVSNPSKPSTIASVPFRDVRSVDIDSNQEFVVVADGLDGVFVINVSNITNPHVATSLNPGGVSYDAIFSPDNTLVYVAGGAGGLKLLKFDNPPPKLQLIQSIITGGNVIKVNLGKSGTELMVADGAGGTQIFNILTPPKYLSYNSSIKTDGQALDAISSPDGKYLYLADGTGGFKIIERFERMVVPPISGETWQDKAQFIAKIAGSGLSAISTIAGLYMKKGLIKSIIYKKQYTGEDEYIYYPKPEQYHHVPHNRHCILIEPERIQVVQALRKVRENSWWEQKLPQYFAERAIRKALPNGEKLPEWLKYDMKKNALVAVPDALNEEAMEETLILQIIAHDGEILEEFRLHVSDEEISGVSNGVMIEDVAVSVDEAGTVIEGTEEGEGSVEETEETMVESGKHIVSSRVYSTAPKYDNPILNCPELLQLAYAKFGVRGLELIDVGSDKEKYIAFSKLRNELGAEAAIESFLEEKSIGKMELAISSQNVPKALMKEQIFIYGAIAYHLPCTYDRTKYLLREVYDIDMDELAVEYGIGEYYSKLGQVLRPTLIIGGAVAAHVTSGNPTLLLFAMAQPEFGTYQDGMFAKVLYYATSAVTVAGVAMAGIASIKFVVPIIAVMAINMASHAAVDVGLIAEDNIAAFLIQSASGIAIGTMCAITNPHLLLKGMHIVGIAAQGIALGETIYEAATEQEMVDGFEWIEV